MEIQTSPSQDHEQQQQPSAATNYRSKVDTSRPFRSVKEAVAIFGERFLVGEIYAPKPSSFQKQENPCFYTPSSSPKQSHEFESCKSIDIKSNYNDENLVEFLKKLEAELEETKTELKILKERESQTEVALASLNAELHKNMSKLAQAEAAAASKAIIASKSVVHIQDQNGTDHNHRDIGITGEGKIRDLLVRLETSPTLAQMMNTATEKEGLFGGLRLFNKGKKMMKKKPIIPLVGEFFSRKKGSSTSMINPLYASSDRMNLNSQEACM